MRIISARWGDANHTRLDLVTDEGPLSITRRPNAALWDEIIGSGITIAPCFTILSARYANAEGTAIRIVTQEAGGVIASESDTPALWQEIIDSGVSVDVYVEPANNEDYKAMIRRRASALEQDGKHLEAILLLKTIGG